VRTALEQELLEERKSRERVVGLLRGLVVELVARRSALLEAASFVRQALAQDPDVVALERDVIGDIIDGRDLHAELDERFFTDEARRALFVAAQVLCKGGRRMTRAALLRGGRAYFETQLELELDRMEAR
jgi:hypothetical protein